MKSRPRSSNSVARSIPIRGTHRSGLASAGAQLVGRYWRFAQGYYRKPDGTATGSLPIVKRGLRRLRKLYGNSPAGEFGPLAFKTVRQSFIDDGLRRFTITRYMAVVKGVFPYPYRRLRACRSTTYNLRSADRTI